MGSLIKLFLLLQNVIHILCDESCHDSVIFHRIDTIFPSSGLFCVIHTNENDEFADVETLRNEEEWEQFIMDNHLQFDEYESSLPPLVYRLDGEDTSPFHLPTSFISDQCTGVQELVIGNTLTTSCIVSFLVFNKSECEENEFLSAHQLFETFITSKSENSTTKIQLQPKSPLYSVMWDDGICINVIRKASLNIKTNGTIIIGAEVEVIYDNLTATNYSTMMQTFHINYENILMPAKNKMDVGYQRGDTIYVSTSNNDHLPFTLPSLGECAVPYRQRAVKFMVSITTGCMMRVMNCDDAQKKVSNLYDGYESLGIDRYPKEEEKKAMLKKNSNYWKSPADSSCSIPTSVSIEILYSKQGTLQDSRTMIVHALYDYSLEEIVISTNMSLLLTFSVYFTDITSPALPRFASLPRIDLRLPNDFFYPFVSSTTRNDLNFQPLSILILYALISLNEKIML